MLMCLSVHTLFLFTVVVVEMSSGQTWVDRHTVPAKIVQSFLVSVRTTCGVMEQYPTLKCLKEELTSPSRPSLSCLFRAMRAPTRKKKQVTPEPSQTETPVKPERPPLEELQQRIVEHKRARMEIRAREKERERRKLEMELAQASSDADLLNRAEFERRQQREDEIRARLEAIQQRREQRELEHEVSKRRSRAVREHPSSIDALKQKVAQQEREEEERRHRILEDIKKRYHTPVTDGLHEVKVLLDRSKEKAHQRSIEMRAYREESDNILPVYQGRVYEEAMREFARARHGVDDEKHDQLYRLAKMNEYGRVVGQIARRGKERSLSRTATNTTPPPLASHSHHNEISNEERRRQGDEYMRTAGARKLPPGLKLQPLAPVSDSADVSLARERDKKGLQYLRELREKVELVRGKQGKETFNKSEVVHQIKQLRVQTNLLERKLVYGKAPRLEELGSSVSGHRSREGHISFEDDAATQVRAGGDETSYVDVINAKLEMLRKLEELRRKAPRDDSKW